jgi:hypothetical protein
LLKGVVVPVEKVRGYRPCGLKFTGKLGWELDSPTKNWLVLLELICHVWPATQE